MARRRGWAAAGRKWLTALAPLMPSLAVGVTVLVVDGVMLVGLQFPAVLVAVLVALCLAAVPVLVTRIERPALWAVLAWGLPLLGGGIAPFVGVLVVDRYLAPFGLSGDDIQLSLWTQWAVGVAATAAMLLGVYVGVAFWVVGTRLARPRPGS